MTQRTQPSQTDSWVYDTATNGVGKLASETVTVGSAHMTWSYTYDALSRPSNVHMPWYTSTNFTYQYDASGRLSDITYPSGYPYHYTYNATGYLSQITRSDVNWVLWTGNARDADQHITQETFGNGVVTNRTFDASTGLPMTIWATKSVNGDIAQLDYRGPGQTPGEKEPESICL